MKTQFATTTLLSSYAWLDYTILQNGQAFTNNTSQFYYQPDARLGTGFVAYVSPFRSFVWDSGVSGATIFNSVSGVLNGQPFNASRGASGMITDFINGRVIFPVASGFNANMTVSGSYSFKDFNLYFANQSQEQMVFTNKYYLNSRFTPPTGLPPTQWNPLLKCYNMVTPCIFVTNANEKNDNWAIGGIYNTVFTISLNVLAENMGQLEGVLSILTDQKNGYMMQLPNSTWPLNFYGDYRSSGWNYQSEITQYGSPGNLYFISQVKSTKVSDYAKLDESIFLGIVDITLERVRTIR